MRTTIRLDEELLRQAKQIALQSGKSLTAVIEDALRETLARKQANLERKPVRLPVFHGSGLQPGVDLDDTALLLERMEAPHDFD